MRLGVNSEQLPIITRLETSLDREGGESKGKRNGPVSSQEKAAIQMYFDGRPITQIAWCRNDLRAPKDVACKNLTDQSY